LQQEIAALQSKSPELSDDVKELVAIRSKIAGDDVALWRLHDAKPFLNYKDLMSLNRLKVMMVANEKGGVGKTTTVVNLAAFFDKKLNKRVLVIDLDLQGSASTTLLQAAGKKVDNSQAERLLSGQFDGKWVQEIARDLNPAMSRTRVITAIDTLADFEELTKMRWALRIIKEDVRYNLAKVLLTQEIQENCDIVLIDVGPRITLGSINALVAATHLIVPTIVDQLSAERVEYFLRNARTFRDLFNPNLKLAGVIGTMTYQHALNKFLLDCLVSSCPARPLLPSFDVAMCNRVHLFEANALILSQVGKHLIELRGVSFCCGETVNEASHDLSIGITL
jgi:chromosome partitioning protein